MKDCKRIIAALLSIVMVVSSAFIFSPAVYAEPDQGLETEAAAEITEAAEVTEGDQTDTTEPEGSEVPAALTDPTEPIVIPEPEGEIISTGSFGTNVTYTLYENGVIVFSGSGSMRGRYAYDDPLETIMKLIRYAIIEDGINNIGVGAFNNCSNLIAVSIPDSVTAIGESAFSDCSSLKSISISKNITEIGYAAFTNCTGLESIFYDANIETINGGFSEIGETGNGIDLVIGESVNAIPDDAFYGVDLKSVTIPEGVTSIGANAFAYCLKLERIEYNAVNAVVNTSGDTFFDDHYFRRSIAFPAAGIEGEGIDVVFGDPVESIPYGLFGLGVYTYSSGPSTRNSYGANIKSVHIGKSVKTIALRAFTFCDNLTEITVSAENRYFSSIDNLVYNKAGKVLIFCPGGITGPVVLPESLKTINECAFYDCFKLRSVTIPAGVTEIGDKAFYQCRALETLIIRSSSLTCNVDTSGSYSSMGVISNAGLDGDGLDIVFEGNIDKVPDYFVHESNLRSIKFYGDEPVISSDSFPISGTSSVTGYFPYRNETWYELPDYPYALGVNSSFYWVPFSLEHPQSVVITAMPEKTAYSPGESLDLTGLEFVVSYSDQCKEKHMFRDLDSVSCDLSSVGRKTVTMVYRGYTFYAHVVVSEYGLFTADSSGYPASSHPYESDLDKTYEYCYPDARHLSVSFSNDTFTEYQTDYIYLYDAKGNEAGVYSGDELAGQTIEFDGDRFSIKLVSDSGFEEWGFAVDRIDVIGRIDNCNGTHDYDNSVEYTWADDNSIVTASVSCKDYGKSYSEAAETAATEDQDNMITYVAEFADPRFSKQTRTISKPRFFRGQEVASGAYGFDVSWMIDDNGVLWIDGTGLIDDRLYDKIRDYSGIKHIVIGDGIAGTGEYAFNYLKEVISVEIPGSVVTIGQYAFNSCYKLSELILGEGVEFIGRNAFSNCQYIEEIDLPDTLKYIGINAFAGCSLLKTIEIPDSVESIGESALSSCQALESVKLPKNLSVIENGLFSSDKTLKKLIVPEKVISVGTEAFRYCSKLETIVFTGDKPEISTDVFEYCGQDIIGYYPQVNSSWDEKPVIESTYFSGTITWMPYDPEDPGSLLDEPGDIILGDITGDDIVSADDLTALSRHVAKIETITDPDVIRSADVNQDGVADANDLTLLSRYVAKIITSFDE